MTLMMLLVSVAALPVALSAGQRETLTKKLDQPIPPGFKAIDTHEFEQVCEAIQTPCGIENTGDVPFHGLSSQIALSQRPGHFLTPRLVLNAIVKANPGYSWSISNGTLVLRWNPQKSCLERPAHPLRIRRMKSFAAMMLVLHSAGLAPSVTLSGSLRHLGSGYKNVDLDISSGSVIDALTTVAALDGEIIWNFSEVTWPTEVHYNFAAESISKD
jgi:hypothetical protein